MNSSLRVSLVIPAYNEAAQLRACLEAVAKQSTKPYEVLVVDNNSRDTTVEIAQSFPFVKVLHEKRQGVLYARATGFSAARGDIIGRIDADTIIPDDWISNVRELMADSEVAAFSGRMEYYDLAMKRTFNRLELMARRYMYTNLARHQRVFLQGCNMAMRRDAWEAVVPYLCERDDIHEDYDIAIHLQELGYNVSFEESLYAQVSVRRVDTPIKDIIIYALLNPYTYKIHNARGRTHMYVVIAGVFIGYGLLRLLHRGYDPGEQRFMVSRIFQSREHRVTPFAARE